MRRRYRHPFADRWNHNTHYFPLLASRMPADATRLLDVGCGDGTFCRFVADQSRRVVVGIDSDVNVLPLSTKDECYVAGSAIELPFVDESFAVVTLIMVLHHVQPERALEEASRILSRGGLLLVLGYGRSSGPRDLAYEARDLLAHKIHSRRMRLWEPPTIKADALATWTETRATADASLPGSSYKRLPMWRYLIEWHKPL